MRWWTPILGALAVIALLFISPLLGLLAIGVILVVALASWVSGEGTRPCPRCGERVKNGVLDCPHCGFDFRAIGA